MAGAGPVQGAPWGGGVPGAELDPDAAPDAAAAADPARSAATPCVLLGGPAVLLPDTTSPGVLAECCLLWVDSRKNRGSICIRQALHRLVSHTATTFGYRKEVLRVVDIAALRLETCTPESHRVRKALPGDLLFHEHAVVEASLMPDVLPVAGSFPDGATSRKACCRRRSRKAGCGLGLAGVVLCLVAGGWPGLAALLWLALWAAAEGGKCVWPLLCSRAQAGQPVILGDRPGMCRLDRPR